MWALALGIIFVIASGGTVLTDWRDWPVAALYVVVGGLFAAGGVRFLRGAGKPMFEFDPTGLTYHPLDDISWKNRSASHGNASEPCGMGSRRGEEDTCTSTTKNCRSGIGSRARTIS